MKNASDLKIMTVPSTPFTITPCAFKTSVMALNVKVNYHC